MREPGSYRDSAGFVFRRDGVVYRQIEASFAADWEHFTSDGLSARLVEEGLILPHEAVDPALAAEPPAWRVMRPEPLETITYPYEWSFSQLKDAALRHSQHQNVAMSRQLHVFSRLTAWTPRGDS